MAIKKRLFRDMAVRGGATAAPTQATAPETTSESAPTSAPVPVTNAADSGTVIAEQTKALEAKNKANNAAKDLEKAKTEGAVVDSTCAVIGVVGSCIYPPFGALVAAVVVGVIQIVKSQTISKDITSAEQSYAEATTAAADAAAKAKAAADKIEADKAAQNEPAVEEVPAVEPPVESSSLAGVAVDAQGDAVAIENSASVTTSGAEASGPVVSTGTAPVTSSAPVAVSP